jgi:hypothetical protein
VPPYPEPVVDRMNTGRGIRGREADGRPVPYNAAQLVDAISLDYESGCKGAAPYGNSRPSLPAGVSSPVNASGFGYCDR